MAPRGKEIEGKTNFNSTTSEKRLIFWGGIVMEILGSQNCKENWTY